MNADLNSVDLESFATAMLSLPKKERVASSALRVVRDMSASKKPLYVCTRCGKPDAVERGLWCRACAILLAPLAAKMTQGKYLSAKECQEFGRSL